MSKPQPFYIKIKTPIESEMIQRIAFSFGFKWVQGQTPEYLTSPFLGFYPQDKSLVFCGSESGMYDYQKVNSFDELMLRFNDLPEYKDMVDNGHTIRIHSNGDVGIIGTGVILKNFDGIATIRKEFLTQK